MKKAVILAAGVGSRMKELTAAMPKCLIPVRSTTSLDHILKCLRSCGIDEAVVVAGYMIEAVRAHLSSRAHSPMKVSVVENKLYDHHGCEYSMSLSAGSLAGAGSALIVEGDLLMPVENFRLIADAPAENCVLLRDTALDPTRSVAACGRAGLVEHFAYDEEHIDFARHMRPGDRVIGESMQLWKFGGAALARLRENFEDYLRLTGAPGAPPDKRNGLHSINMTVSEFPLEPIILKNAVWINLNTFEDVEKAGRAEWVRP